MFNKKILILAIILISLLTVSAVTAADNATMDVSIFDDTPKKDIGIEEIPIIEQTNCDVICADNGTFTALQNKIKSTSEGSTINLENDYSYDEGFSVRGIEIDRRLTINGNGHTIDGKNAARIFKITCPDYSVTIIDINFVNGRISGEGGAVCGYCNVINCIFTSNAAVDGGAFAYASAQNCTFISNTAKPTNFPLGGDDIISEEWSGGAIFKGSARNCKFTSNTALYGGALYNSPAQNCVFTLNTALDAGAMHGDSASNCLFIKNSADNGAGAFKQGMALNCTFIGNYAGSAGGAMMGSAENSTFINNTAYGPGGAMCAYIDESYAVNCIFINNSALDYKDHIGDGGAICMCSAKDCIFTNNFATSYGGAMIYKSAVNCTFNNNGADNGGAIYAGSATDCTFNSNEALGVKKYEDDYGNPVNGGNGGAMYFGGPAKNCTFNSNYAHNKGGALYEVSCENCTFNNNREGFTSIESSSVTTTYNVNRFLIVTLKDSEGKSISGVKITVNLNGIKTLKTDNNGQIKIQTATLVPKTYVAKITFKGDKNYSKSAKAVKVIVKKAKPKMVAFIKTYKVKSIKKYAVTLKNNKNKIMKNTKVTLKINGKIYSAKTNGKGVATFTLKLTKKGTFISTITYAGSSYYNKLTKSVKISVK